MPSTLRAGTARTRRTIGDDLPVCMTNTSSAINQIDLVRNPPIQRVSASRLVARPVRSAAMPKASRQRQDKTMVGPGRLELPTPRLSSVCSNQLSYGPIRVEHTHSVAAIQPPGVNQVANSASKKRQRGPYLVKKEKRRRRFAPYRRDRSLRGVCVAIVT